MNNERNNTTAGGIGFCGLLAVAFIVLKLTGVINWSWLWVLAPIWIPTAITLAIIVIVLVAILVRELTKGGRNRSKKQNRRRLFPVQEERSDKAAREGKNRGGRNIERAQSLLHRRHRHHGVYQQARHGIQRGGRPDR